MNPMGIGLVYWHNWNVNQNNIHTTEGKQTASTRHCWKLDRCHSLICYGAFAAVELKAFQLLSWLKEKKVFSLRYNGQSKVGAWWLQRTGNKTGKECIGDLSTLRQSLPCRLYKTHPILSAISGDNNNVNETKGIHVLLWKMVEWALENIRKKQLKPIPVMLIIRTAHLLSETDSKMF